MMYYGVLVDVPTKTVDFNRTATRNHMFMASHLTEKVALWQPNGEQVLTNAEFEVSWAASCYS